MLIYNKKLKQPNFILARLFLFYNNTHIKPLSFDFRFFYAYLSIKMLQRAVSQVIAINKNRETQFEFLFKSIQ